MIRGLYTVRDEASQLFVGVQMNETDDVAMRGFDYALSSNQMMAFRPEDFSLWLIGHFDDVKGVIEASDPKLLKRGVKRGGNKK